MQDRADDLFFPLPQAKLPDYQPIADCPFEDADRDLEDPRWNPGVVLDSDLMMYLRAARSMAAFQGLSVGTTMRVVIMGRSGRSKATDKYYYSEANLGDLKSNK